LFRRRKFTVSERETGLFARNWPVALAAAWSGQQTNHQGTQHGLRH
jgi:hypothetical protein